MSPSRTRRPIARVRPRSELVGAVAVGVAIPALTALLIWLMRPGTPGAPGSGGLFNRQPRVTWLVVLAALAFGAVAWWLARARAARRIPTRPGVAVAGVVAVVGAVVAGLVWPGGLVRHWPSLVNPDTTPGITVGSSSSVPGTSTTAKASTSTSPAVTTTSRAGTPTTPG